MHHAHYFQGNSVLTWDFKTDVKISVPWYLGLAFRTRQPDGVLLQAHAGQYTTLLCQVGPQPQLQPLLPSAPGDREDPALHVDASPGRGWLLEEVFSRAGFPSPSSEGG